MVGQHIHTIGWMPRIVAKHKQFTSPLILLAADPINSATIRNRRFLDVVRKRHTKQQDGRHGRGLGDLEGRQGEGVDREDGEVLLHFHRRQRRPHYSRHSRRSLPLW